MALDQDQFHEPHGGPVMSFGAHLEELRVRLIRALIVPVVIAVAAFSVSNWLLEFIKYPLMQALAAEGQPPVLQVLSPSEMVVARIQLSIWAAVVVSVPWILWQVWQFVAPGLYAQERRYARFLVPLSTLLVLTGLVLLYLAMPFLLRMLIQFGEVPPQTVPLTPPEEIAEHTPRIPMLHAHPASAAPGQWWMLEGDRQLYVAVATDRAEGALEVRTIPTQNTGAIAQQFRLSEYIDFMLFFGAAIAIAFQMPVAVLLLGWLGVLEIHVLRKYRKHAFFLCAILAAVITPTVDVLSMLALLIPLYLLYELGIVLLHVAPAGAVAEGGVTRNALRTLFGQGGPNGRTGGGKDHGTDGHEGER